jgi:hypothetical protein
MIPPGQNGSSPLPPLHVTNSGRAKSDATYTYQILFGREAGAASRIQNPSNVNTLT